jgi:signal transduction histidine kinase
MLFTKKQQDVSGKYLQYFIEAMNMMFIDENVDALLRKTAKDLDLEFISVAHLDNQIISIPFSTYPYLQKLSGTNPVLMRYIQEGVSVTTTELNNILVGILDVTNIDNLQYSRRIKQLLIIPQAPFAFIIGSDHEIPTEIEALLRSVLGEYIIFTQKILQNKEQIATLSNENKLFHSLELSIKYALMKNDFSDVSSFIADQLSREMHYPDIIIMMKDGNTWNIVSATSSLQAQRLNGLFTNKAYRFEIDPLGIQSVLSGKTFEGDSLNAIFSPAIDPQQIAAAQEALHIHSVYAIPMMFNTTPLGCLLCMSDKEKLDKPEEGILQSYANLLASVFEQLQKTQNIEEAKDSVETAYKKLEDINKEKDNLMSIASHELRTPATVARDAVSLLLEYKNVKDPNVLDKMDMVKEAADRELSIITTMLEVSRINTKKMELVIQNIDMTHLISLAVDELEIEANKKGLRLEFIRSSSPLPIIKADPTRIREVIDNLLTNAIKYSDKGTITVECKLDKDFIETSVKDMGKGIPPEVQSSLFQMFHRINSPTPDFNKEGEHKGGLGLGLYIVKNIIDAHHGTITVKSKVGEGSTFTFRLPIA